MEDRYVPKAGYNRLLDELYKNGANGNLTEDKLRIAMVTFDDHDIGSSVGVRWILNQPTFFAAVVRDADAFLRPYFGQTFCMSNLISVPEVLLMVPGSKLTSFVRDAYIKTGAYERNWVAVALEVGVSKADIAEMVLARLETSKKDGDVVYEFLDQHGIRGGGQNSGDSRRRILLSHKPVFTQWDDRPHRYVMRDNGETLRQWYIAENRAWEVLTDEQFEKAIRICGRKSPG